MTDPKLPPAITGTDMRLDALIQRVDRLCDLLTPAKAQIQPGTIELREPASPAGAEKVADEVIKQMGAAIERRAKATQPKTKRT